MVKLLYIILFLILEVDALRHVHCSFSDNVILDSVLDLVDEFELVFGIRSIGLIFLITEIL